MCKVEVQVLARTEVRKEAKENTAFIFMGSLLSLSHMNVTPNPMPDARLHERVLGSWWLVSPALLLSSLYSNWFSSLLSPPNWSFHGHHSIHAINPIVNFPPSSYLIYQYMIYLNSTPDPLKRLSSRGFQDIILSWFFSYWSGFAGFSSFVLNAQMPQCSVLGFLIVFLYPLSLTWCPHLVSALYNASYKPMAPKCTPVACPASALLTQISSCPLSISSGVS